MTAGDYKIIIEKNADFSLEVAIKEGVGVPKNLNGYSVYMRLMYIGNSAVIANDTTGIIYYLGVNADGEAVRSTAATTKIELPNAIPASTNAEGGDNTGEDGIVYVKLDKAFTGSLNTLIDTAKTSDLFATEYNYRYELCIYDNNDSTSSDDIKVLRGKCAVRE